MTEIREQISQALEVEAGAGGVTLASPGGVMVTLTREAAAQTARRLLHAAGEDLEPNTYQKPLG